MLESEALEAIALYNVNAATYLALYMSVTFAYLTVSYFVGANLTKFQAAAISALYTVWSLVLTLGTYANTHAWEIMAQANVTILDTLPEYSSYILHYVAAIVMLAGIFLSLYFMWDVRQRNARDAD